MKPRAKGWCPGAYRPMMSGDGLIVRVRPYFARLDVAQVLGLCALTQEYGNGLLDLTNRANIQIRGVQEAGLDDVLEALAGLQLLDATPELEERRNIIITPFWQAEDDAHQMYAELLKTLPNLPGLPAKFGFLIDTSDAPLLSDASADIRIERGGDGLIVRADGAPFGRPVTRDAAIGAAHEMAQWFVAHKKPDDRRMVSVLTHSNLPLGWKSVAPLAFASKPVLGPHDLGVLLGAAFGQIDAAALAEMMRESGATALRVTPWRLFLLEGVRSVGATAFVTRSDDPLLQVDACPGAPHCASASVQTRELARQLAVTAQRSLHVSGCAKGCARKGQAELTFVGRDGRFDLVRQGHAWDAPEKTGLGPQDLLAELTGRT